MFIDGRLKSWNDARGFGFIAPARGGPDVFVHISAFGPGAERPSVGERLSFEVEIGERGRPRARDVRAAGTARSKPRRSSRSEAPSPMPQARRGMDAGTLFVIPWRSSSICWSRRPGRRQLGCRASMSSPAS